MADILDTIETSTTVECRQLSTGSIYKALDIGDLFDVSNMSSKTKHFSNVEKQYAKCTSLNGKQRHLFLTKQGLHRLMHTLDHPTAVEYRSWATSVLEQARQGIQKISTNDNCPYIYMYNIDKDTVKIGVSCRMGYNKYHNLIYLKKSPLHHPAEVEAYLHKVLEKYSTSQREIFKIKPSIATDIINTVIGVLSIDVKDRDNIFGNLKMIGSAL